MAYRDWTSRIEQHGLFAVGIGDWVANLMNFGVVIFDHVEEFDFIAPRETLTMEINP